MRRTFVDLNFDEYVALAACGLVVNCWRDVVEPFHSRVTDGEMALMNMRHVEKVIELLDLELEESPFTPAAYEQWAVEAEKDVPHHVLAMNVELGSFFWNWLGVQLTAAPFEEGEPAPEILPRRDVDDVFGDAFDDDAVEEIWSRVEAAAAGRHALVKWALWGATICGNWFRHPNWEARIEHFLAHAQLPDSFALQPDELAALLRERPFALTPEILEWCAGAGIHYSPVEWGHPELPFESPGLGGVSAFERMLASADEDLAPDA